MDRWKFWASVAGALILALTAGFTRSSLADSAAKVSSINTDDGVALKRYDPVAYFTDNKVVKDADQFTAKDHGVIYKFASAAHRDAFNADPAKYEPQFGGYCAYGLEGRQGGRRAGSL